MMKMMMMIVFLLVQCVKLEQPSNINQYYMFQFINQAKNPAQREHSVNYTLGTREPSDVDDDDGDDDDNDDDSIWVPSDSVCQISIAQ